MVVQRPGGGQGITYEGVQASREFRDAQRARVLLDELCWWGLALREGRAARPYVS